MSSLAGLAALAQTTSCNYIYPVLIREYPSHLIRIAASLISRGLSRIWLMAQHIIGHICEARGIGREKTRDSA